MILFQFVLYSGSFSAISNHLNHCKHRPYHNTPTLSNAVTRPLLLFQVQFSHHPPSLSPDATQYVEQLHVHGKIVTLCCRHRRLRRCFIQRNKPRNEGHRIHRRLWISCGDVQGMPLHVCAMTNSNIMPREIHKLPTRLTLLLQSTPV